MEKVKIYRKKDGRQFRVSSVKEKDIAWNSTIRRSVINSTSFKNRTKVKVLLYVLLKLPILVQGQRLQT